MAAPDRSIVLEGVSYSYPSADRHAIAEIEFTFEPGKVYAVCGRNGSGKSTLARTLNGILVPTEGRVISCGLDTAESAGAVKRLVAMVFQNPQVQMIGATVEEEIAFGPENLSCERSEIRSRVDEAMELAGIEPYSALSPRALSLGEKQLVAFAGAFAMKPAFLVCDEVTSMLDAASRRRVLELMERLKEKGVGIIQVTHFLAEAAEADTVVVLDGGRLVASGHAADVLTDPERLERWGLGALPATVVAERLRSLGYAVPGALRVEELLRWATG